jgi:hypothetical protein
MATGLPADHLPFDSSMTLSPRVIELCFQTAGLWEMGVRGVMGLPQHIDRISVLQSPDEAPCYAVVRPDRAVGNFEAEVVDANGRVFLHMAGYRTAAVPTAIEPDRLHALRAVMTAEAVAA